MTEELVVSLPTLHDRQEEIRSSPAKRKVVRAGRRFGKTWLCAVIAVESFLDGRRVLYAAPTYDQLERFWYLVKDYLKEVIKHPAFHKNEAEHLIERTGTPSRIRAKTAWNADTMRGDYADLLILDEFQMMDEKAWNEVGAPMLLDNDGDAIFIYTPPSLRSRTGMKAKDPQHAAKLFKKAQARRKKAIDAGRQPRWDTFVGSSLDNPTISLQALEDITEDISDVAYRQEILAEDVEEAPGALWKRGTIEANRVVAADPDEMDLIVVSVDPTTTSEGDECGILVTGRKDEDYFVFEDGSTHGSPEHWATAVAELFARYEADYVVAESNQGGEMVVSVIHQAEESIPVLLVHASRGKRTRAEPVSVVYSKGRVHHVGSFPELEDEMCIWVPGDPSPNHMDALVWGITYLQGGVKPQIY